MTESNNSGESQQPTSYNITLESSEPITVNANSANAPFSSIIATIRIKECLYADVRDLITCLARRAPISTKTVGELVYIDFEFGREQEEFVEGFKSRFINIFNKDNVNIL